MITYTKSTYATLTTLQHAITHIHINTHTEINTLELPNQGSLHVNQGLHYNTTHTYYTFQRHNTIHNYDNLRRFTIHNHFFTYQRNGNHELQIQALDYIVADLHNQIYSFTFGVSNPDEPTIGII